MISHFSYAIFIVGYVCYILLIMFEKHNIF